jgi:hypothetical protein
MPGTRAAQIGRSATSLRMFDEIVECVTTLGNKADGQQLAEKHCKRFGKSARFNRMQGVRAFYDCQSPS